MSGFSHKILGLVTLALIGLLHLAEVSEYFGEERYIGVLFGVSAIGAAVGMYGILRDQRWGWALGTLVAASTLAGYLLSRTIGLPNFREASWSQFLEPMGMVSLIVEVIFLIVAVQVYGRNRAQMTGDMYPA